MSSQQRQGPMRPSHSSDIADDDWLCDGDHLEHDYEVMDERDGIRSLVCRRCGAETFEEDE